MGGSNIKRLSQAIALQSRHEKLWTWNPTANCSLREVPKMRLEFPQPTNVRYARVFESYRNLANLLMPLCTQMLRRHVGPWTIRQRSVLASCLRESLPSDYAFLFLISYSDDLRRRARALRLVAAIHLLQTSTLIVDDVLDGAKRRFHLPSVQSRFGVPTAVASGFILHSIALTSLYEIAKGMRLSETDDALGSLLRTIEGVYKGQWFDVQPDRARDASLFHYKLIIDHTTSDFLGGLARCGAVLGNRSRREVATLEKFGRLYGRALQVMDDIADVRDQPSDTGKDFATDLRRKRLRLPTLLALRDGPPSCRRALRNYLAHGEAASKTISALVGEIRSSGAIARSNQIALHALREALNAISDIRSTRIQRELEFMVGSLAADGGLLDG
jgi:geranylgeranyl pyrophosphate synthase